MEHKGLKKMHAMPDFRRPGDQKTGRRTFWSFRLPVAILILFTGVGIAHANESDTILGFADALFREGDYQNAIHEYRRYLFLFPDAEQAISVRFRIAAAHRNAGDIQGAMDIYRELRKISPQVASYANMKFAETLFLADRRQEAIGELKGLLERDVAEDLWPRAQFLMGIAQMESRAWRQATSDFRSLARRFPDSEFTPIARELAHMSSRGSKLPRHSAFLSAALSTLLPGSGQAYNGRWSDGVYAFLVVETLTGVSIYYVDQERYRIGVPLALASLFFHAGNIYGGMQSARYYNTRHESQLLGEMRQIIKDSGVFAPKPMTFSFRF